jgi:hypothetical protein
MKEPKDPRMSGRIAMIALVLALTLVGLMVWVGA